MATRQMDGIGLPSGPAINLDYIEENDAHFYPTIPLEYGDKVKYRNPGGVSLRLIIKKKQAGLKTTCVGLVDRSHEKTILKPLSG